MVKINGPRSSFTRKFLALIRAVTGNGINELDTAPVDCT